jgi:transcriptional regulator with XRE-family HTH domain
MEALADASANATDPTPGYGRRIQAARLGANKTRRELAQTTDLTYGTVRRYELEQLFPSDENLIRIAKACRTTAAYLMFGDVLP